MFSVYTITHVICNYKDYYIVGFFFFIIIIIIFLIVGVLFCIHLS